MQSLGRFASRGRSRIRNYISVIARSEATKQSILPLRGAMDCVACARNDGTAVLQFEFSHVVPAKAGTHSHRRLLDGRFRTVHPTDRARRMGSCFRRNDEEWKPCICAIHNKNSSCADLIRPSINLRNNFFRSRWITESSSAKTRGAYHRAAPCADPLALWPGDDDLNR